MFMGILPGVLKQMHRPNILLENLRYIKNAVPQVDEMFVQADGGVNFETISEFSRNGINNFVCGYQYFYLKIEKVLPPSR